MSYDLQAVRKALCSFKPSGFNEYDTLPGDATSPAFVPDLPERIVPESAVTVRLDLKVWVAVARTQEAELLNHAIAVGQALDGATHEAWAGCRFVEVNDIGPIESPSNLVAAAVSVQVFVNPTTPTPPDPEP